MEKSLVKWVNIGKSNEWLVAKRHKAIVWSNVDLSSSAFCGIYLRGISKVAMILIPATIPMD